MKTTVFLRQEGSDYRLFWQVLAEVPVENGDAEVWITDGGEVLLFAFIPRGGGSYAGDPAAAKDSLDSVASSFAQSCGKACGDLKESLIRRTEDGSCLLYEGRFSGRDEVLTIEFRPDGGSAVLYWGVRPDLPGSYPG